ncbi:MAG: membrane protein of unknown function [Promethearchaeota archaeon]|jgi:hypothetical protein|nr:MAG: membrane protein of unknown function [Candidatus Lokiarchaeota archaeon]
MISFEIIRNWAWKISLFSVVLIILALIIPNIIFIPTKDTEITVFWIWNFYYRENNFVVFPYSEINDAFKIYMILGYMVAAFIIVCILLILLASFKEKGASLGRLYLLWIISGIILIIMGIIAWGVRAAIITTDIVGIPVPLGALLILLSGVFTILIGVASWKIPR